MDEVRGSESKVDDEEDGSEGSSSEDTKSGDSPSSHSGIFLLRRFMDSVRPPAASKYTPWSMTQLSPTPTLLPNLKFHDLVFGHVLGRGSFSEVKYARLINKSSSRSQWSEYAVKVISIKTIRSLGYSRSVNREIAVLRHLSHPGVARLVSAFRFRDGAHLVLEYASGGDLHALVTENGSLDEPSARFACGEVLAALCDVQAKGLVYGDLKPENVLVTESGHFKLGDFGGCRAVIAGGKHDYPSDIWSFGCLLFFCLAGKPPIIDDTDDSTMRRVISFARSGEQADFFGKDRGKFSKGARDLIGRCTEVSVVKRATISDLAADGWWGEEGVLDLHGGEAVELNVGRVKKGTVDRAWTRRQHSMIWSPQNEKYDFEGEGEGAGGGGGGGGGGKVEEFVARTIQESEEGDFRGGEEEKEGGGVKIRMMARIMED
ncbi:hypothetical protein TrRE_jg2653 [Triparma retinervis]|uniref:Protein kinase domain-containing protein n=1 Tax=Triparma retinervis TaxID=2557542 RepID=A0A9W6ZDX4_9STRA|nr:hypothetical protein TrRE_jg2653 [Triparma retinervis]